MNLPTSGILVISSFRPAPEAVAYVPDTDYANHLRRPEDAKRKAQRMLHVPYRAHGSVREE